MFDSNKKQSSGFTLIELLVVIAVIGILSGVILASLNSARARARDAYRKSSLRQLQSALELYYDANGTYPVTDGNWWGVSVNGGSKTTTGPNAYIPGLTPTYMHELPVDPLRNTNDWSGFLYLTDGVQYKVLSHDVGPESFPSATEPFYDPVRPTWALMICSGEPACSEW